MTELLPFFIVLFAGLFFAEAFSRLHLPWVVALIVGGIIIGPSGFGLFEANATIEFMGQIGLVFLMFMAGLEVNFSDFKRLGKRVGFLATLNGLIPLLVGIGIGLLFGYETTAAILIGVIFISSSIAVVIPSLDSLELISTRIGKTIIEITVIQDVTSLLLLSVVLQTVSPVTVLPLGVFYILLFLFLVFLRWLIPKISWVFKKLGSKNSENGQNDLGVIFVILFGTVVVFELLGLHPIIAGFFAGMVLTKNIKKEVTLTKLRTMSYGFFIPIFFVVIGSRTDLSVFSISNSQALLFTITIVVGSFIAKFGSGYIGARIIGFKKNVSKFIASSTTPQLSTTLAAAFAGHELGLLDDRFIAAMVVLSIITTLVAPLLIKYYGKKVKEEIV